MSLPTNSIVLGDCLEVMRTMPDKCVDLVLTDPPYGINITQARPCGGCRLGGSVKASNRKHDPKPWDAAIPPPEVFAELQRVGKNVIIFGGNYFAHLLPPARCWLVWDKLNGANDFADCELAWSNLQDSVRKFEYRWQGMLVQNASDRHDRIHPTQKPVGLFSAILERYAPPGALVFDPFSGSGTTAIACHNLGLDFVCVEKDPDYHAASVARLRKCQEQARLPLAFSAAPVQGELFY